MPSYICHNCQHELKTDEATLLYLITHPPKCTRCGYEESDLREAKSKQFYWQVRKKGMRRTIRIFKSLYQTGHNEASTYLQRITGTTAVQQNPAIRKAGRKKFAGIWVIVVLITTSLGFLPLLIETLSGPPEYCRDIVYVPGEDGGTVWSLHSVGTDEHKIKVKVHALPDGELLIKNKIETDAPLATGYLLYCNGKVWILGNSYMDNSMIYILNESDGSVLMNTSQFINSEGRLKSGLAQLQYFQPYSLGMTGKDGTYLFYNIEHDRYFSSVSEYNLFSDSLRKQSGYFGLESDYNSGRISRLFYITSNKKTHQNKDYSNRLQNKLMSYYTDYGQVEHKMLNQINLLDAELVYQDEYMAALKHKSELGDQGKNMFSAFDKSGRMMFAVNEEELFPEDFDIESNSYMFNANKFTRSGSLLIIHYSTYGICGIDTATGDIAWTFWFTE